MTTNTHRRQLDRWEAEVGRPRERDEWRTQAYRLADVADALLNEWRADHPKQRPHVALHDGPMAD